MSLFVVFVTMIEYAVHKSHEGGSREIIGVRRILHQLKNFRHFENPNPELKFCLTGGIVIGRLIKGLKYL